MGCGASRPEEDDDVVSLCKERKRLLKSAIDRRYSLADAHSRYNDSLNGVAAAIKLFVARHSSPLSPFLIAFPSASDTDTTQPSNPMLLSQSLSDSTHLAIGRKSPDSVIPSDSSEEESEDGEAEGNICEHFYGETAPPVAPAPQGDFTWDFFYPFDTVRTGVGLGNGFGQSSEDDDLRRIRIQEGIPELEEDGERDKGHRKDVSQMNGGGVEVATATGGPSRDQEHKGLKVIDTEATGRELLEALKDVEDYFVRAYESGLDVSRLLEVNRVHLMSSLEEIKESPKKLVRSLTWSRSTLSRTSSSKSSLAPSSKSSSTWSEFGNDLIDDYGGMTSGSHSQTLDRLYAWEKKLYEEVKAGEEIRRNYQRKCSHLKRQDDNGDVLHSADKTNTEVNSLYTRILVGLQTAESISKRIEKLRDEELQPQLVELLQGLTRIWKIMLESHETQYKIMSEVKSFTCPSYGKFCNDSHRLATFQLGTELQNWCACFAEYFSAQKAYIEALNGWLSKFIAPEVEFYSGIKSSGPPYEIKGPQSLVICHYWLASLEKLPDKPIKCAMKSFGNDVRAIWVQQGEEQQQKRKVDGLAKELDRMVHAFQKAECRILETKVPEQNKEADIRSRIEYLSERKLQLDSFRKRLDAEKAKHLGSMQETKRITLNAFQVGFFSVFESLTEFSKASLKMYDDLVKFCAGNPKIGDEKNSKSSYIMGRMGMNKGGGQRRILGPKPGSGSGSGSGHKDRDEDLLLFREIHKREKERITSLLQPVSDEFEPNSGSYPLYRIASAKKGSGYEFLPAGNKHDYDWLKTPPATPLFPSLEMEANAAEDLVVHREIPILHPLSRFSGNSEAPKEGNGRSSSSLNLPKLKIPPSSTTLAKGPLILNQKRGIHSSKRSDPGAITSKPTTQQDCLPKIFPTNLSRNMGTESKMKPTSRGVSPLVRTKIPAQIPGFPEETPPNLKTDRSSSASRGRSCNPVLPGHHRPDSSVKSRRQSSSPCVARNRKVEYKQESEGNWTSQKGRAQTANGAQVLGSRMVDKVMNARKSGAQEREAKPKLRGLITENPAHGRMTSKVSLDKTLKMHGNKTSN